MKRDGWTVEQNDFSSKEEYMKSTGMDITVTHTNGECFDAEVKNFSEQKRPYGSDKNGVSFAVKNIINRAKGSKSQFHILIITFLNLLTIADKELLKKLNWGIVEVGERLTYEFYSDKRKLYKLANQIKNAYQHVKSKYSKLPENPFKCKPVPNQSTLDHSSYPIVSSNPAISFVLSVLSNHHIDNINLSNRELHDTSIVNASKKDKNRVKEEIKGRSRQEEVVYRLSLL